MSALLSQRYWSRADAPGRARLLAALGALQVGQRLRLADVLKGAAPAPADAGQPADAQRADDEVPPLVEWTSTAVRAGAVDTESREVEFTFSSETPYERWWGIEVLGHRDGEVDMGWLASGRAPFLADHRMDMQIGVIPRAWIKGRRGHAVARFGSSPRAEQELRDVTDGVRVNISVGYEIRELELVKKDGDTPTYRVTEWMPLENSLVSIPADMSIGIGRSVPADDESQGALVTVHVAAGSDVANLPARLRAAFSTPAQPRQEHTMSDTKPLSGEEQFRANVATIGRLAQAYGQWLKPGDEARAIADGADTQQFNELIMERMKSGATDPTTLAGLGATDREARKYSFLRAIQAQMPGNQVQVDAGFEREVSNAIAQQMGRSAEGIFVPADVMFRGLYGRAPGEKRDFTAGTAGEAGNLIQTTVDAAMWTDVLRPALVLAQLGVTVLPGLRGNLAVPCKTVAGTLAALTEVAAASETQPTTTLRTLSPKRISAYVEPSKQAIIQSEIAIEPMLRQDLLDGAAVLVENQGINGSGSSPNARGIRNVSGIGSVAGGTNGANFAWTHVVGLETAVANANAASGARAGYLSNTKIRGTSKTTQKATNLPFMWDNGEFPLNGYRVGVTNNVPSNLTKGTASGICSSVVFSSDWSMFVLGLFGGMDVTVDPYTLATTGQVRITLNQFFDFVCRQPGAFASMDDALTP